ncbi:hypothetical protein QJS10_CPB19g01477 [Acorus calamus]|uniref:Fe2OG dioxygenase domain-containing protein n=1 Tax=Acorus calamus TaxID=4465 RepID=A0AAV9CKT6_ACOCL|nr:hypothetical protein QJS10_CPB19g01477 [Acorus calamus]
MMASTYDRASEVKKFDDSKIGVKGLLDAGATTIPRIFHHPSHNLPSKTHHPHQLSIPTIDLSLPHPTLVHLIRDASRTWGFFSVTNHGIPQSVLDRSLSAVRSFNELPAETKSKYYSRDTTSDVIFNTNYDLHESEAATWRDTLQVKVGPVPLDPGRLPEVCRDGLLTWGAHVAGLGERLMGLLSEGLGVGAERLKGLTCHEGRNLVGHYYPYCPEPDLTMGLAGHTDGGVLTVLLQDHIGGLQVKAPTTDGGDGDGEEVWVDVRPVPGSLIINLGDLMKIISNNEYKCAKHRVLANPYREPRISIAVFFTPGRKGESDLYGPLPELISPDKPALYREFTMTEFIKAFYSKGSESNIVVRHFGIRGGGSRNDL